MAKEIMGEYIVKTSTRIQHPEADSGVMIFLCYGPLLGKLYQFPDQGPDDSRLGVDDIWKHLTLSHSCLSRKLQAQQGMDANDLYCLAG